jgi:hypothetical protein
MEKVHITTDYQKMFSFLNDMLPTVNPELYKNKVGKHFWVGQKSPKNGIEIGNTSLNETAKIAEWETWCYCDPENVSEVLAHYQKLQQSGESIEISIES